MTIKYVVRGEGDRCEKGWTGTYTDTMRKELFPYGSGFCRKKGLLALEPMAPKH